MFCLRFRPFPALLFQSPAPPRFVVFDEADLEDAVRGPVMCSEPGPRPRGLETGTVWVNDHIPIIFEMGAPRSESLLARQGHVQLRLRGVHPVKHVMSDITAAAARQWHTTIFANT